MSNDSQSDPEKNSWKWAHDFPGLKILGIIGTYVLAVAALCGTWWLLQTQWKELSALIFGSPLVVILGLGVIFSTVWMVVVKRTPDWKAEERDVFLIVLILAFAIAAGLHLVASLQQLAAVEARESAARVATLWACAWCSVGFLGGFLFGIPRVLQGDDPGGSSYLQRVNTNLEQISDWLTKIIVGLGLVQLRQVPSYLGRAAEWMAQSFTPKPGVEHWQVASVSNSIILLYSVIGFLAGYLITRLYLSGAFRRAEGGNDGSVRAAGGKSDTGVSKDSAAAKLRKFWMPDDKTPNEENEKRLLDWMQKAGVSSELKQVPIPSFINLPAYTAQREAAVKDLKL